MGNKLLTVDEFRETVLKPAIDATFGDGLVMAALRAVAEGFKIAHDKAIEKIWDESVPGWREGLK